MKKDCRIFPKESQMKKWMSFLCTLPLLGVLLMPVAAITPERVPVRYHDESVLCYGEEIQAEVVPVFLNGEKMKLDVPAVTQISESGDGRTMIPVRPIAEALGASVEWNEAERQVAITTEEKEIILTLGSPVAQMNGKTVDLPGRVPAVVARYGESERTLVPLRFVSEQLGGEVVWDNDTFSVYITREEEQEDLDAPPKGKLTKLTVDDNAQTLTLHLNIEPNYRVVDFGDRIAIDLLGIDLNREDGYIQPENPVVVAVRYAQHGSDLIPGEHYVTRVVLDLAENCSYQENVTLDVNAENQTLVVSVVPLKSETVPPTMPEQWNPQAYTVVLDAGHGGTADGAYYEEVKEKELTLPVTLRAAELLREKGYNVVLTRNEDVYMDLYDRCDVANGVEADIFVSIHANASATNRSFQGIFTYSYPRSTRGEKLAGYIQSGVVETTEGIDRGLLTNDYVVLRETTMPAALLEMGFMSCHEELERLVQPEYQEKVAQGIALGVENYFSTLPEKKTTNTPSAQVGSLAVAE